MGIRRCAPGPVHRTQKFTTWKSVNAYVTLQLLTKLLRTCKYVNMRNMLWLGHLLLTRLYFGIWTAWSVAPDIPMILILSQWNNTWREIKDTNMYTILYKVPHSFFSLLFVPKKYRSVYAFHILCDILSHTGDWSIQPFFPYELSIHGIWDPVEW